jgi:hypothetical protein
MNKSDKLLGILDRKFGETTAFGARG